MLGSTTGMSDDAKSVVILMTCGPEIPSRCASPFFIATLLASMDAKVHIFLTMEAVKLAVKGVSDDLVAVKGGKKIIQFIREAKEAGATIQMCKPALPGFCIDAEHDLIPEVDDVSSGGVLADLILSSDKVITF